MKKYLIALYLILSQALKNMSMMGLRLLDLFGQLFPENAWGCRVRGNILRPRLKRCGNNFQVGLGAKLEHLGNIEIGDDVYIGHGCWISGVRGGIEFYDQVMLGPYVCMVSSNHTPIDGSFRFGPSSGGKIIIQKGVWLAAKSVVTSGVVVGEFSLVASGAVVTKDVDAFSIVGGVPAKKIGDCREKYGFAIN